MKLEEERRLNALRRREELQREEEQRRQELRAHAELRRENRQQEEARLRAAEQQKNAHNAKLPSWGTPPRFAPGGRQEDASTPIPIHVRQAPRKQTPSPPSKTSEAPQTPERESTSSHPSSPSQSPKLRSTHTVEEQNLAATRIQTQFRIHSSFRALTDIESQFDALKKSFAYPTKIDFQKPGSEAVVTVPAYRAPSDFDKETEETDLMEVDSAEGRLAYTSTNFGLNTYSDALDKILIKLDGVESWGHKSVRMRRRSVVKAVEREASKLDRYWRQAWADFAEKQSVKPAPLPAAPNKSHPEHDAQSMDIDLESPARDTSERQEESPISIPNQESPLM
jgi:hypothetical protein